MEYRISFSPNFLKPFTWKCGDFKSACLLANELADFDLGNQPTEPYQGVLQRMISAYKQYRRQHGINHPDLIHTSTCTIDKFEDGTWWIVSEDLENEDETGIIEADNDSTY